MLGNVSAVFAGICERLSESRLEAVCTAALSTCSGSHCNCRCVSLCAGARASCVKPARSDQLSKIKKNNNHTPVDENRIVSDAGYFQTFLLS